jgi:hypothetical protein
VAGSHRYMAGRESAAPAEEALSTPSLRKMAYPRGGIASVASRRMGQALIAIMSKPQGKLIGIKAEPKSRVDRRSPTLGVP